MAKKRTKEVFGISTEILKDSYVDRGDLDAQIAEYLDRDNHIALRGPSKSGKTWLRQKLIPNALVIQCRLGKTVEEIYRETLGQLGIRLELKRTSKSALSGSVEADGELGIKLISKVRAKLGLSMQREVATETQDIQQNIESLSFICELINESGRRLVIEDFHYLNPSERKRLAYDLKTMWDLQTYATIIGVWSDNNLLLNLNPELSARVREITVSWEPADLRRILDQGTVALNLDFPRDVRDRLVQIAYGNAGILQRLTLDTLDRANVLRELTSKREVCSLGDVDSAAMFYAEELNSIYQNFAHRVSRGIRTRQNSTAIYAHILAVVLDASDEDLASGVPSDQIFRTAHGREPRIQQGNLKTALGNLERLQVDDEGRGLVLTYADGRVRVVDHQLLLYRQFATVQWPWEDMIRRAEAAGETYDAVTPLD